MSKLIALEYFKYWSNKELSKISELLHDDCILENFKGNENIMKIKRKIVNSQLKNIEDSYIGKDNASNLDKWVKEKYEITKLHQSGDYFSYIAQEIRRLPSVNNRYTTHETILSKKYLKRLSKYMVTTMKSFYKFIRKLIYLKKNDIVYH